MARIGYASEEDLDPDFKQLIVSSLQEGKTVNVYRAIGNNQEVLKGFRQLLGALWNYSGLTDREREIVILTAAYENGSEYEWHQHNRIGMDAGLKSEEISAIARNNLEAFSDKERTIVAYSRDVVQGSVTDEIHSDILGYFDEETIVGAASIAAGYTALALMIDALNVEIESSDEFVGWNP